MITIKSNHIFAWIVFQFLILTGMAQERKFQSSPVIEGKIDSIIELMTLEEKIGQLNQLANPRDRTGPTNVPISNEEMRQKVAEGKVGSLLSVWGSEITQDLQRAAVEETRLGIPLVIGVDIIHGYKTIFPIPLGEAASWDLEAIEQSSRIAAIESAAAGIHWTFAPMVDISREPRWGRIAEGAGEDVFLGSEIARARVRGFQGNSLSTSNTIAACAKHFAAYGAAEAGKDYNTTDVSDRRLRSLYLPPFKAALDEGAATFMAGFNALNGIPVSSSEYLLTDILREEWEFEGFVVSDWNSIGEIITHGAARDKFEAGQLAFNAGVDMDMEGNVYNNELSNLLDQNLITEADINESVRRILRVKFQLGLFDNPYQYGNRETEQAVVQSDRHRAIARDVSRKSIVLLKNENKVLPLSKDLKNLAVIGPLADNSWDMNGPWAPTGNNNDPVTILEGIKEAVSSQTNIHYAKGANINDDSTQYFKEAVSAAQKAEVVVLCLGEGKDMSGEANSRADIGLPGVQLQLAKKIHELGKPVVLVLTNGRPMTITWSAQNLPAILETWFLGTESGHAIADVLFGDYNPSGKLPVTFPYAVGQVPVHYDHLNTGRPFKGNKSYTSNHLDIPSKPLYPFGFGLSYTTFEYGNINLSSTHINSGERLKAHINVTNTGSSRGEEVVQLYIRDKNAFGVARPLKELKGFEKIALDPGETKEVVFEITAKDLAYYKRDMSWGTEPGDFELMIGGSSDDVQKTIFSLNN